VPELGPSAPRAQIKRGPIAITNIIKGDMMGRKCTTYRMEKGIKMNPKKVKGRYHLGDTGEYNSIINLKYDVRVWNGVNLFRTVLVQEYSNTILDFGLHTR
jgi:hypothetical protein